MSGVRISESQVRRLAHEIGQELIDQRDRKAVEHRRRELEPRTGAIPEAVAVEATADAFARAPPARGPGSMRPRTRKTRSPAWPP
jgi:hypothetical protein